MTTVTGPFKVKPLERRGDIVYYVTEKNDDVYRGEPIHRSNQSAQETADFKNKEHAKGPRMK